MKIVYSVQGQSDIPLSMFAIDETLFNAGDLKLKNIHKISCTSVTLDLVNLHNVDTTELLYLHLDESFKPVSLQTIDGDNKQGYSCDFTYKDSFTMKDCAFHNSIKNLDYLDHYVYCNNTLMLSTEKVYNPKSGILLNRQRDTFEYRNNLPVRQTKYWYHRIDNTAKDSIVRTYKYDDLERLTELLIIPSTDFMNNMEGSGGHYFKHKYVYKYTGDRKMISTYSYPGCMSQDSFLFSEEEIRVNKLQDYFIVNESSSSHNSSPGLPYYDFIISEEGEPSIAYKYGEVKKVDYFENTKLPGIISIHSDLKLFLYYFDYMN